MRQEAIDRISKVVPLSVFLIFATAFAFSESYEITFKVFDAKSFKPLKGAEIYLNEKLLGKTGDGGTLKVKLEVGDYEILVRAEGYSEEKRIITVIIDSDEEFYLLPKVSKKRLNFTGYKRKFAVLVGVSETMDKNIPPLKYADSDVYKMKEILGSYLAIPEDNIYVLKSHPDMDKGEKKSLKNILLGILKKLSDLSSEDLLVIYMSTHGETVPDEDGDEPDGYDEVFAMSDSYLGMPTTFLFDDELSKALENIDAKKILLFDACYIAGRKSMKIEIEEEEMEDDLERSADVVITSSAPGAASYESDKLGSSLFVAAITRTFEEYESLDENEDGIVDSEEFFEALKRNLEDISQRLMGFVQSPTLSSKENIPVFSTKVAYLSLKVLPSGAKIFLDGKPVETKGILNVEVGYHTLRVSKEGYEPFEETVKLHPGMNKIEIELLKKGGWLVGEVVDSKSGEPIVGAEVIVIGSRFKAITDDSGRFEILLPAGVYKGLVVKKDGYEPLRMEKSIKIAEGKRLKKLFKLTGSKRSIEVSKVESSISVYSNLEGAMVFLDERFIGKTPIEGFPMDPGIYNLKAVSPYGEVLKKDMTIPPGKDVSVFLEFSKTERAVDRKPKISSTSKAVVIFNTIPSGAEVFMIRNDEKRELGETPLTLKLEEGWYAFEIVKSGYKSIEIDEDYYLAGDEVRYDLKMENLNALKIFKEAMSASGKRRIEFLERARQLDPYNVDIAVELLKSYMNYSERDEEGNIVYPYRWKAEDLLKELLSTMSDDPRIHLYAGIIYYNKFDFKNARREWREAISLSPSFIPAYYYMYKSYKGDLFMFGEEKKRKMKKWALKFVSLVRYLKSENMYRSQLEEIYSDFPDLKEWKK